MIKSKINEQEYYIESLLSKYKDLMPEEDIIPTLHPKKQQRKHYNPSNSLPPTKKNKLQLPI